MTGIAGHSGRPTPCHQVHGMQGHLGVGLETLAQPGVPELWGAMGIQYPKGDPLEGVRTHDGHQSRDAGMKKGAI